MRWHTYAHTNNNGHAAMRRDGGQDLASDNAVDQSIPKKNDDVQQDNQFAWPPSHGVTGEYLPVEEHKTRIIPEY